MLAGRHKGFTLMELVVTLIVLALMTSFALPFMSNGVRAYNDTSAGLQTLGKLRYAGERLVRELREVNNTGGGFEIASPLTQNASSITFTKSDGITTVTVSDAAPALLLAYSTVAGGANFTLSDELSSVRFNYYRSDGITPATTVDNLAYIEFEIVLDNGNSYAERSRVALRNRP